MKQTNLSRKLTMLEGKQINPLWEDDNIAALRGCGEQRYYIRKSDCKIIAKHNREIKQLGNGFYVYRTGNTRSDIAEILDNNLNSIGILCNKFKLVKGHPDLLILGYGAYGSINEVHGVISLKYVENKPTVNVVIKKIYKYIIFIAEKQQFKCCFKDKSTKRLDYFNTDGTEIEI